MKLFIQENDYKVWRVVTNESFIPKKRVNSVTVIKKEDEWDKVDIKMVSLCDNAKEIWDKLKATYESTSRVTKSKISLLALDYELFKEKLDERIKEIFDRFTDIINGLKALGKTYANKEMVKKILNSLTKSWEAKMAAIDH
ncbi:uncharacterized protein LOC105786793 [Gossypium raimondii]|uniref:uncharacterized protein LOC105786793 n=1 Tax=Gossypium raimondii TaxID=29730 RepID=UPI00063B0971|nr:uncharacterized protein LOC105786793 [Gossypium raimondii]